jgi:hypothetical protein
VDLAEMFYRATLLVEEGRGRGHGCAEDGRSFFNDCQSLRELQTTVNNDCSMRRKAPSVGSRFKCNRPFLFFLRGG